MKIPKSKHVSNYFQDCYVFFLPLTYLLLDEDGYELRAFREELFFSDFVLNITLGCLFKRNLWRKINHEQEEEKQKRNESVSREVEEAKSISDLFTLFLSHLNFPRG